jgi:predicted PurR-regulated permease PerM
MLSTKIAFAVAHSNEVIASFQKFIQKYEDQYNFQLLTPENTQKLSEWLAQSLRNLLNATFNTLTIVATMYFMLFFMLTQGRKMESAFYEWVPLKDENVLLLRNDMNGMVLSNAIGIPLIAFIQGVVGLIGYYFIGVKEPVFWFVITCVTAMLPVIGAAFAYVPLAILFFANGDTGRGIIMLIYGFGVIGLVDNFFRFYIAKKIGDVHPLITVFGVIAGVNVFGFIGIIFGPILLALFLLLIKIYLNEFSAQRPKSGVIER